MATWNGHNAAIIRLWNHTDCSYVCIIVIITAKTFSEIILIIFIVMSNMLIEIVHHDHFIISFERNPILITHGCGNRERHVPLDQIAPCYSCVQSNRVNSLASISFSVVNEFIWIFSLPQYSENLIDSFYSDAGARSPPHNFV